MIGLLVEIYAALVITLICAGAIFRNVSESVCRKCL